MPRRDEIIEEISKLEPQLSLESNGAFQHFLQYFKDSVKICDDTWHNFPSIDKENFIELKASKIAALNVLNYLDNLKFELEQLKAELAQLDEQE